MSERDNDNEELKKNQGATAECFRDVAVKGKEEDRAERPRSRALELALGILCLLLTLALIWAVIFFVVLNPDGDKTEVSAAPKPLVESKDLKTSSEAPLTTTHSWINERSAGRLTADSPVGGRMPVNIGRPAAPTARAATTKMKTTIPATATATTSTPPPPPPTTTMMTAAAATKAAKLMATRPASASDRAHRTTTEESRLLIRLQPSKLLKGLRRPPRRPDTTSVQTTTEDPLLLSNMSTITTIKARVLKAMTTRGISGNGSGMFVDVTTAQSEIVRLEPGE